LPIKIIQSNERAAEVRFVCDVCGQHIHTSVIPRDEVEDKRDIKIICCNCKKLK